MKKVININFQGRVVTIEENAYENLKAYIESLRSYFSNEEGSNEIINDIEWRISELFDEIIKKGNLCVTEEHLESIIKSIGRPQELQQEDEKFHTQNASEKTNASSEKKEAPTAIPTNIFQGKKKFMRDETNKKIGGVCAGIANYFGADVTLVRIIAIVLTLFYSVGFWIYIILWAALPGTTTTAIGTPYKKLFRDPSNKNIAGVCSGLAQYLNIEIWIVRLIFIVGLISPGIFGITNIFDGRFGASISSITFLMYLILWIVVPKAKRPTDFLAMRGENIDINSIRSTRGNAPQEENTDDKKKVAEDTKENISTQNFVANQQTYQYENNSSSFGDVLLAILKIFAYIIVGIVALSILSTFIGLGIAATFAMPYLDLYLDKSWQSVAAVISLICFVWVPVIAFCIWIIRKIIGYKQKSAALRNSFLILWAIGLVATIFLIISGVNNIKYESELPKQNIALSKPDVNKLIVDFETGKNKDFFKKNFRIFPFKANERFYVNNMYLDIEKSNDSNFHAYIQKYANGNSVENANNWANKIDLPILQNDSVLTIKKGILINNNNKFRNQKAYISIEVPVGKKIYINENYFGSPNVQIGNIFLSRKNRNWNTETEYIMTQNGLEPTNENTQNVDSITVSDDEVSIKKEIVNGKSTYFIDDEEVDSLQYESALQKINKKDSTAQGK